MSRFPRLSRFSASTCFATMAALGLGAVTSGCASTSNQPRQLSTLEFMLQGGTIPEYGAHQPTKTKVDPNAPGTIARSIFRGMLAESASPDPKKLAEVRLDWMRRGRDAYLAGDRVSAERAWRVGLLLGLENGPRRETLGDGKELVIVPVLRNGNIDDGADWLRLMVADEGEEFDPPMLGTKDHASTAQEHLSLDSFVTRALKIVGGLSANAMVVGEPTAVLVVASREDADKAEAILACAGRTNEMVTLETQVTLMNVVTARKFMRDVTGIDPMIGQPRDGLAQMQSVRGNTVSGIREVEATKLSAEQQAVLADIQSGPSGSVLTAPRLTTYGGQLGNISMVNQIAYIRDFEIQRLGDVVVADPVIDTVNDGVSLLARAHPTGHGYLASISVTTASVSQPIATFTTRLAKDLPDNPVTIQIPLVSMNEISSTGEFEAGQTYVISRPLPLAVSVGGNKKKVEQQWMVITFKFSNATGTIHPDAE